MQASPKLFESYGDKMESFENDCKAYQKVSQLPIEIKNECKVYNSKMNAAFNYGYKLDPYVDQDNIDLDQAEKYNILLHSLEDKKENILDSIYSETRRAREENNINYYKLLIGSSQAKLYSSDYKFMSSHEEQFSGQPQYIKYKEKLIREEKLRIKKEQEAISSKDKNEKLGLQVEVISCSMYVNKILNNYEKALVYIKSGMPEKADKLYQITLNKKRIFLAQCNNTQQKKLLEKGLVDLDIILKKNSISMNLNKIQNGLTKSTEYLSNKAKRLEDDISRLNREHARKMADIERERKERMSDLDRKIKELESQL